MTAIGALLTAIGLLAALVARAGVAAAARGGGVAGHLRRLLTLIALLLGLRLAQVALPSPVIVACTMVVAAWLPLATLRLAEELVRRHAARWLKLAALAGAIGFSVLSVTFGLVWTGPAVVALALFQAVVMAAVLLHLVSQRTAVSLAERRAADMLALAFALAVPLLATDFERLFPDLPFRGGPFAALVFVLACSRLAGEASRPLRLLGDLAIAAGAGGIVALGAWLASATAPVALALTATATAAAALALLAERFADPASRDEGLLPRIANAAPDEAAILAAHPLLASGIPVTAAALADLPDDLIAALAAMPVVCAGEGGMNGTLTGAAHELLGRYGASHLLRLSANPPRFLAVSGGALDTDRLTGELTIIARLLERAA
ncbi:hypothetical protein [Porphyrobacter sp. AAP60]|uniref:hypothetical protein n=1 Tax=Porphyrobacter sp. AAP60 TaxID=1523423 RepID=UPI0006B9D5BB|nr:hypothetical protein [Porphyrobacter sp. AAP60]KPF62590.1 hypothetical protein IP79_12350 [Porphyrobacter sp. AAP60]